MAEEQEKQEEEKKEEGKKSNLLIIIVGGFLLLILIIGGVLAFVLSGGDEEQANDTTTTHQASNGDNNQGQQQVSRKKSNLTVGPMFEMDQFIVNLLSENGRRYLKIKIDLELSDEALQDEIKKKIPVLRDIIIRIASSKTLEEISTEKGKEKFKDQIVKEINENLQDGNINNVFFTDFVIQ